MRCDILTNWSVNGSGFCKRALCGFRLKEGCAVVKYRWFLKSKLIGLAEQEANIVRMIIDEQKKGY